jgi:hypothetical protein
MPFAAGGHGVRIPPRTRGRSVLMESASYRGYIIWRHAIMQQEDILQPERYAGSGTITRSKKLIEASGVLGHFDTEEETQQYGLDWARAWVDHG